MGTAVWQMVLAIEAAGAVAMMATMLWGAPVKRITAFGWGCLTLVSVLWLPVCVFVFVTGRTQVLYGEDLTK